MRQRAHKAEHVFTYERHYRVFFIIFLFFVGKKKRHRFIREQVYEIHNRGGSSRTHTHTTMKIVRTLNV